MSDAHGIAAELASAFELEGALVREAVGWSADARWRGLAVRVRVTERAVGIVRLRDALSPELGFRHAHAAALLDVVDVAGRAVLVEERGGSIALATWLERERRLPFLEARYVLLGVAEALAAAHAAGIAHGAIDGAHVTWTAPHAWLGGFGVARTGGAAPVMEDDVRDLGALAHAVLAGAPPERGGPPVNALREHVPPGLARLVVRALDPDPRARPAAREMARTVAGLVTPNPAFRAPHLVAQARFLARRRGRHLALAQERYERAAEIDAQCAEAHAGIAETLCRRALRGDAESDVLRASAAAERALALDATLAAAHVAAALCELARGDDAAARARIERALALDDPSRAARCEAALLALRAGDLESALRHAQLATAEAPDEPAAWRALGWVRLARGERAGARAAFQRAVDLADADEDRASLALSMAPAGASPIEVARRALV